MLNSPESKEKGKKSRSRDATSRNYDERRGGHRTGNLCQRSSAKDAFTRLGRVASLRRPTSRGDGDRSPYYHPSRRLRARPDTAPVRNYMSSDLICCFEDQDIKEAEQLMRQRRFRRLPVLTREKQVTGIVALDDLASRAVGVG